MMAMRWILIVLVLLALGSAPATADDVPGPFSAVSGTLTGVDHELRTVELGKSVYRVPAGVLLPQELAPGMPVTIHFDQSDDLRVVTKVEQAEPD
jgi:hypothetical protein